MREKKTEEPDQASGPTAEIQPAVAEAGDEEGAGKDDGSAVKQPSEAAGEAGPEKE